MSSNQENETTTEDSNEFQNQWKRNSWQQKSPSNQTKPSSSHSRPILDGLKTLEKITSDTSISGTLGIDQEEKLLLENFVSRLTSGDHLKEGIPLKYAVSEVFCHLSELVMMIKSKSLDQSVI
jgi:hypothetical protein